MKRANPMQFSRRDVLTASLVGGALVLGYGARAATPSPPDAAPVAPAAGFGPFLRIEPDGAVVVISKHIDVGQGAPVGLAVMIAEEMDADWQRVRTEQAPANVALYGNTMFKMQGTGGSSSIRETWMQYRKAGAAVRDMFVRAAAAKWNVAPSAITVKNGVVSDGTHKAGFGELVADAAKLTPAADPVLKSPKDFTLIGNDDLRRIDKLAKVTGTARYTIDVREKNMLVAMVVHPPRFGGVVKSFDGAAAKTVPGVVDVFQIPGGVAVTARSTYAAMKGREAVKVVWDETKAERRSSEEIAASFKKIAQDGTETGGEKVQFVPFEQRGASQAAFADGEVLHFLYEFPYLAHLTMEPMNCVTRVDGNKAHLVFGSQGPTMDQAMVAAVIGGSPEDVTIDILYAGGSFGRRFTFVPDYVSESAQIAKHVGGNIPVKLVWTREDDTSGGRFRPMCAHAVTIKLGKDGFPEAWRHRMVIQSIVKGSPPPFGNAPYDPTSVEGIKDSPYLKATPIVDAQLYHPDSPVTVHAWRSVGATFTAFVMEHTIDRLAKHAGKDPVAYRRALYEKAGAKRHLAALDLAVEKAGTPKAEAGWARGVAVHESFDSVVADIAEVSLQDGKPRVRKVVMAVDCGIAVMPDQVRAQMEGGMHYGLCAGLYGAVSLKEGVVANPNFGAYPVLRMDESPEVDVHIVPSAEPPMGVGEPGTPGIAPAVANAVLALTGEATERLPFVKT